MINYFYLHCFTFATAPNKQIFLHLLLIQPSTGTMAAERNVEFKTYDGLTLRGTLFPAGDKKPLVIMTAGVSSLY